MIRVPLIIFGPGQVGRAFLRQLVRNDAIFSQQLNLAPVVVGLAESQHMLLRPQGMANDDVMSLVERLEEGQCLREQDGAEVLCLGCAGMALMDKAVEEAVGVPVLDGTVCAVKLAEGMHDYGLQTSKVAAFKRPDPKEYVGCSELYDSV